MEGTLVEGEQQGHTCKSHVDKLSQEKSAFADVVQVIDGTRDAEAMLADASSIIDSISLTDS